IQNATVAPRMTEPIRPTAGRASHMTMKHLLHSHARTSRGREMRTPMNCLRSPQLTWYFCAPTTRAQVANRHGISVKQMPPTRNDPTRRRGVTPDISYVPADAGETLPVIDVTHPAFAVTSSVVELTALAKQFVKEARSRQRVPF